MESRLQKFGRLMQLAQTVKTIHFLTSGQVMAFDENGEQIGDIQKEFTNGEKNIQLLRRIAENAETIVITKWREWSHELTKEEFIKLCNL